jgi:transposase
MNRETTRAKNMLKAVFRQVAVRSRGGAIYIATDRDAWLQRLGEFPALHLRAQTFFELMDVYEAKKQRVFTRLRKLVSRDPAFELLQTAPGIGPVLSAGYIALIETPHRFSRRNKLWSYAGLGMRRHDSDDITYANRSSRNGCRPLKWLVMLQFHSAVGVAKAPNHYKTQHRRLIQGGTSTKAARRLVCRSMLSAVRVMWMKGEPYREIC